MILPFSTQINGKATYFVEKIWQGFPNQEQYLDEWFQLESKIYEGYEFSPDASGMRPKLHTIREDELDRWNPGEMIDFYIRTKENFMFCFAPSVPVVSTQEIIINWFSDVRDLSASELAPQRFNHLDVVIGKNVLTISEVEKLAINDGFESVEDFFAYFNKDFTGKIIHWTDLRY